MKKITTFFGLITLSLFFPSLTHAETLPTSGCPTDESINTAIGCIPVGNQTDFIRFILLWAIGLVSGVFLILIGFAAIQIITASGDPKKAQAGREMLTSAVGGLIFLILSVFFLNAIGVELLGLIQIGI